MNSKCDQLIEINEVSALLRRNGYSFSDYGTSVVVNDPVHRIVGAKLVPHGSNQVVLQNAKQARQFIAARS
ncbi:MULTISPECIES: hypothetical protein [Polaromonas]|uniref:Uncharacterized protein n=1 Tax=Polaromonas aquatica TaxID=332657 RepID=A0ABW1TW98_9BURK